MAPLFIAAERLDTSEGKRRHEYRRGVKLPGLDEEGGLDCRFCARRINQPQVEERPHIVTEDFRPDSSQ